MRIIESKQDIQAFIGKFGQDTYDCFVRNKDRIKNSGISTDLSWHVKHTSFMDMDRIVGDANVNGSKTSHKKVAKRDGSKYLGEADGYKVYFVTTPQAAQQLGSGTTWCLTGRYKDHGGDENARHWFNVYQNGGVKDSAYEGYYFCISQNNTVGSPNGEVPEKWCVLVNKYGEPIEAYDNAQDYNEDAGLNEFLYRMPYEHFMEFVNKNDIYIKPIYDTTVTISGVKKVNRDIVAIYPKVQNVIIGDGVTVIDDYAFQDCTSLESVTIGNSVTTIGALAFGRCAGLTSVTIGGGVTKINVGAFIGCTGLKSITIPDSVTSISSDMFYNCTSLTSITIPGSATSIGSSAFFGCTALTSVAIGNGVTRIDDQAFIKCDSIKSIDIPDSVTSIGNYAFSCCDSLTSITIPNSVKHIGLNIFWRTPHIIVKTDDKDIQDYCDENIFKWEPISKQENLKQMSNDINTKTNHNPGGATTRHDNRRGGVVERKRTPDDPWGILGGNKPNHQTENMDEGVVGDTINAAKDKVVDTAKVGIDKAKVGIDKAKTFLDNKYKEFIKKHFEPTDAEIVSGFVSKVESAFHSKCKSLFGTGSLASGKIYATFVKTPTYRYELLTTLYEIGFRKSGTNEWYIENIEDRPINATFKLIGPEQGAYGQVHNDRITAELNVEYANNSKKESIMDKNKKTTPKFTADPWGVGRETQKNERLGDGPKFTPKTNNQSELKKKYEERHGANQELTINLSSWGHYDDDFDNCHIEEQCATPDEIREIMDDANSNGFVCTTPIVVEWRLDEHGRTVGEGEYEIGIDERGKYLIAEMKDVVNKFKSGKYKNESCDIDSDIDPKERKPKLVEEPEYATATREPLPEFVKRRPKSDDFVSWDDFCKGVAEYINEGYEYELQYFTIYVENDENVAYIKAEPKQDYEVFNGLTVGELVDMSKEEVMGFADPNTESVYDELMEKIEEEYGRLPALMGQVARNWGFRKVA